jgi:ligand-binding sensor domain-containing protein
VLPIPINVVDAAFCSDVTWLATSQGAARVQGEKVEVFYESNGLLSEFLRGIACDASGEKVFVASGAGVGIYDGKQWRYPELLKQSVNALQLGTAGRLWMATDRGLISFDGSRVRRLDARRGLLENQIRELNIDRFGRLWLLGQQGIALVWP